jgi:DNA-binding MarR family transcriptional regulator
MAIIGRVSRLDRLLRARLETVFAVHDLQAWEFDVLATLLRSGPPHRLTPGELLRATMVTSGAMTNRLDRLESRGLVRRSPGAADRRQVAVTLTARGRRIVDRALRDHAANETKLLGGLDESQRHQLSDLLRRLLTSIEAT